MARFLFAPVPLTGHVNPGLPIARELVARGHDVRWYSTSRFRRVIEETGARFVFTHHAMPLDEERLSEQFPGRPKSGLAQLRFDVKELFVSIMPGQLRDLEDELEREPADVIVGDTSAAVCEAVSKWHDIGWAVYGILPLTLSSRDTAPFGLALLPSSTPLGRLRNRLLYWLTNRVIFREAHAHNDRLRRELGLPPLRHSLFDFSLDADLILQGSIPSFEYPRSDMPKQLRWIGASIPRPPAGWKAPDWWRDLERRRVVLVTQGTINNGFDQLIRPAIHALGEQEVLVVVTTGSRHAEELHIDPLPSNVRVEQFLPYAQLMPKVDVLLTNGGYGSIQIALAHGVPVVAFGKTEDKGETANRVQWSGVGLGVKTNKPGPEQIRNAVASVLQDPCFRARAEAMRYEMRGPEAGTRAADCLEELAGEARAEKSA